MDREILFKAKHEHVVVANKDLEGQWVETWQRYLK